MRTKYFDLGDWMRRHEWHLGATYHHALSLGWPPSTCLWTLAGYRQHIPPDVVMLYDASELRAKALYTTHLAHLFEAVYTAATDHIVVLAQHDPAQQIIDPRLQSAVHTFSRSLYPAMPDHIVYILNDTMQKLELLDGDMEELEELDDGAE